MLQDLALGHNTHPNVMMPCPMHVFWGGGCISLSALYTTVQAGNGPHKWAATPKWASSRAGTQETPKVRSLVAGWMMEESHIMHRDTLRHPGMPLGAQALGWRSPFCFGIHPFHKGTAGPGWKWASLALLLPLVQHEAATGTGQCQSGVKPTP